jgi:dTMP kinase
MTTRRGHFLTFEGLDGCGKSTQMRRLAACLRAAGETVVETVEPGGTAVGGSIRRILLDPANHNLSPTAELLLYFAARAQNVDEVIEPSIARGELVLSDRWTDSSWAYQGFGRNLGTEAVADLDRLACRGRRPDLTIWVDLDLDAGLQRARARNDETGAQDESRMDDQSRAFYLRVVEGYRELARREPARVARVDGAGTEDEVFARVLSVYEEYRRRHV